MNLTKLAKKAIGKLHDKGVDAKLIGSVTKGDFNKESDIDIIVPLNQIEKAAKILGRLRCCKFDLLSPEYFANEPDPQVLFRILRARNKAGYWGIEPPYHGLKVAVVCEIIAKEGKAAKKRMPSDFLAEASKCGVITKQGLLNIGKGEIDTLYPITVCLWDAVAEGSLERG